MSWFTRAPPAAPTPPPEWDKLTSEYSSGGVNSLRLIGARLRLNPGHRIPFDFLAAHVTGDVAIVFLVSKGEPITIEDDAALFPSDRLITQLRVLMERK